jgi:hypothetical protein
MDRAKWVTGSCFSWHRVLRRKHFTVPLLWQLAGKLIHGIYGFSLKTASHLSKPVSESPTLLA